MAPATVPSDTEGRVGHLTDEQKRLLRDMWSKYLDVMAGQSPVAGVSAAGPESNGSAGDIKSKPKDDAAKDAAARESERKELAALLGQYKPEEFKTAIWKACRHEDPDAFMLRFLRARKWDVERGFMMMAAAMKWRIEMGVEEMKEKGEEGMCKEEGFEMQYSKGKTYTHGTDKKGRPITYIHTSKHRASDQSQRALERFTIFNMETTKTLNGAPNEQGVLIFDLTNFGLRNMDWACTSFISKCFEAYYPETLGICLIHKAPFVFSAIWKVLCPLLDPVVRAKIDFTKNEQDLFKYIDPEHLPAGMGGKLDWEWEFSGPQANENAPMLKKEERAKREKALDAAIDAFEANTQKWVQEGEVAEEERRNLASILNIRVLDADPYIRGKTHFARTGIQQGDGTVKWNLNGEEKIYGKSADDVATKVGVKDPPRRPRNGPGATADEASTHAVNGISSSTNGHQQQQQQSEEIERELNEEALVESGGDNEATAMQQRDEYVKSSKDGVYTGLETAFAVSMSTRDNGDEVKNGENGAIKGQAYASRSLPSPEA